MGNGAREGRHRDKPMSSIPDVGQAEVIESPEPLSRPAPPLYLRVLPLLLAVAAIIVAVKLLQGDTSGSGGATALPGASGRSPYAFTAGALAPDFAAPTLDGGSIKLSDLRGHPVMVNFWATWCPPCRSEMPDMENVYAEQKANGVVILAVNVQEANQPVGKFVDQFGLTFPILMDVKGEITELYRVDSLPTSYFIDKEGRIASFNIGAMNRSAIQRKLELMKE